MASSSSSSSRSTLNDLPDELLQHILSFLDMKYVVRTSILAKRWRYFWESLPFLNLDEKVFHSNPKYRSWDPDAGFAAFVTSVLKRSIIHAFRLRSYGYEKDAWTESVLDCNVQQLSIQYYSPGRKYFDRPYVFDCKFLTKIHLGLVVEDDQYTYGNDSLILCLPDSIDLPVLTNLRLEAIGDLSTEDLDKLVAGCLVLETLEIINCEFVNSSNNLTISALQLKHLVITDPYDDDLLEPVSITVSCPNLISFRCRDHMTRIYHLESLTKLEIADMNIAQDIDFQFNRPKRIGVCNIRPMINCLERFYNVKSLTLCPILLQVLSESMELKRSNIQFGNLRYLKVSTPLEKTYLRAIRYLLKSSPEIETFAIQIIWGEVYANNFKNWGEELSLKHLKSIKVLSFERSEMEFLKAMLKKAAKLEKMTVVTSKNFSAKKRKLDLIADELLACPRASSNVKIIFCKF